MARAIRILHIINSLDIGGNERFLLMLLSGLDRRAFIQEVCVPDRGKDRTRAIEEQARALGAAVHRFRVRHNADLTVYRHLRRLITAGRYDVVHTHLLFSQFWGRIAARSCKVPRIVSSEQNTYRHKGRWPFRATERWLSRFTDVIIACSEAVKEFLVRRVGVAPARVRVVYNGVDTSAFSPRPLGAGERARIEKELGVVSGERVVGAVGHLSRQKGHDVLLRAAPAIFKAEPQVRFVIVGRDEGAERELRALATRLGVAERVTFAGARDDVAAVLNVCDVLAHPSRWEGFGLAVAEAMACGRPVVASRVGGLAEVVVDGVTGFLLPPEDPGALADRIVALLRDSALAARCGAAGRRRVEERFSVGEMLRRVETAYRGDA